MNKKKKDKYRWNNLPGYPQKAKNVEHRFPTKILDERRRQKKSAKERKLYDYKAVQEIRFINHIPELNQLQKLEILVFCQNN